MFNANLIEKLKIKFNFIFGKKKNRESIGIHDCGKGTKMYRNTIEGYNTAIKEEGEDAELVENKIVK